MFCIFIFLSLQVVWSLLCGFVVAPGGLPLPAEVNGQVWNVEELVIGYFVLGYYSSTDTSLFVRVSRCVDEYSPSSKIDVEVGPTSIWTTIRL